MSQHECPTLPPPAATDTPGFIFGVIFTPLMLLGCTAYMIRFGLANNDEYLGKGGGGSRWPGLVLGWRLAMVIYGLVVVAVTFSFDDPCNFKWTVLCYFTVWNWFLVVAYFTVALGTSICDVRGRPKSKLHLALQLIGEVEVPMTLLIFVVVWGVLAPASGWNSVFFSFEQISMHVVNVAAMLADFLVSSYTLNPRHVVLPLAWGSLYLLFSIVLNAGTGFYTYFFLDTNTTYYIGGVFALLVLFVVFYCIMYGIGFLKKQNRCLACFLAKSERAGESCPKPLDSADIEVGGKASEFENE